MICRNCGSEIGQGETFCRHCAYSCKHDSSTISVKVSVSGTVQRAPFAISHFVLQSLLPQADCS